MNDIETLAWAAGFLEGEGSFIRNKGYLRIAASQTEIEPLERLLAAFGGSINGSQRSRASLGRKTLYQWNLWNKKAERLADLIYPMLSSRRQRQIDVARACV